ncbi:unnamed protein product [Lepeophtheirus salmonis]|uniref:(salmon louse) hypothetical protein n=1 Tax=Lepeophtheirus salmonis TaxID=72036 RepID=A0A7R8H3T3_LEPSM|nr:unnamed protein product [Lepeophtheirus salmonis]CAF2838837.1 unnamed protein product [Lepeophtheirus salmonis]
MKCNHIWGFGRSPGVPRAYRRSVEFALYALMRRKGDTKSALRDLMLDVKQNEKELSHFWSDREINGFFRAFSEYQKDFRGIACYIGTKTVFQCVEFYYFWKSLRLKEDIISSSSNLSSSSPRHVHHCRLRRRRLLHPLLQQGQRTQLRLVLLL